jgi:hypothetical protein
MSPITPECPHGIPVPRPVSREEAYQPAKKYFKRIPTKLEFLSPPPDDLPPEEKQKAEEEYERAKTLRTGGGPLRALWRAGCKTAMWRCPTAPARSACGNTERQPRCMTRGSCAFQTARSRCPCTRRDGP